jgi:hypothetical protein
VYGAGVVDIQNRISPKAITGRILPAKKKSTPSPGHKSRNAGQQNVAVIGAGSRDTDHEAGGGSGLRAAIILLRPASDAAPASARYSRRREYPMTMAIARNDKQYHVEPPPA